MVLPETARAAEFRRQMTARAGWVCEQRDAAFPGDPDTAARVHADWDAITDPERGWDPTECVDDGEGLQLV